MGNCLVSGRWIVFYSKTNNKMDLLHNKKEIAYETDRQRRFSSGDKETKRIRI